MSAVNIAKAEREVLDCLERVECRLTWEDKIALLENLKEFVEERLEELKARGTRLRMKKPFCYSCFRHN